MDQLNEISDRIKNLRVTAKSRTDTSVELGLVQIINRYASKNTFL